MKPTEPDRFSASAKKAVPKPDVPSNPKGVPHSDKRAAPHLSKGAAHGKPKSDAVAASSQTLDQTTAKTSKPGPLRVRSFDTTILVLQRRPTGPSPLSQVTRAAAISTPLGEDVLVLRSLYGREELGRLSQFDVELLSEDFDIPFEKIIGQNVTLRLNQANGGVRYWNGYVSQFTQLAPLDRYARYKAVIVPWLWFLTRTQDCQIFQNKTVPEILELVFKKYGFDAYLPRLSGKYFPREYCVQYRETAFNFVSRLMEQEGIYYYFDHENGKHTLVLVDSLNAHLPVPGYDKISFHPPDDTSKSGEHIRDWIINRELRPGRYTHTDYNFETPRTSLEVRTHLEREHRAADFEVFDYPGTYQKHDEGEHYARIRIEEIQCRHEIQHGEADARGLCAGRIFKLQKFRRKDQNQDYLIVSTTHNIQSEFYESAGGSLADPVYRCSFTLVPSSVQYRAESATPKPRVQGPQTAVVVGPHGQEIYVDDHGRVKVQFFWDRYGKNDENSSCWLRVSQPWAGKGYGGMNIPRICCEVIVDFLEGDPDRPIITGRVYNAGTMPHASNAGRDGKPGNNKPSGIGQAAMTTSFKSNSTPGGGGSNEITMNDAAGSEGLFLKAQKDEIHNVGNDQENTIGNNRSTQVGVDSAEKVGNNRTTEVGANSTEKIGSNTVLEVGANAQETVGAAKVVNVGTSLLVTAGTSITFRCGASTIHMNQAGVISISGTMLNISGSVLCSIAAPIINTAGLIVTSEAAANFMIGGISLVSGGALTHIKSAGGLDVVGKDTVISGDTIKLN